MAILGGWVSLMSEVLLYADTRSQHMTASVSGGAADRAQNIWVILQGYLAHKNPPPSRTLQQPYA